MSGYCDPEDVRQALQETGLSGSINAEMLKAAITGASEWLARQTNGHWYDSTADSDSDTDNDFLKTAARSAADVRLDVPSSPHRQDRQLFRDEHGVRYPVTHNGPYARIPLPHRYVDTVTKLLVRDRGGDVKDWVAASDKAQGRGEDYYVAARGQHSYGRTYLYIWASSIGGRTDFNGLLTLEYDYGLDWQDEEWSDLRRGVAALAAAQSVDDDDVLSQIPDNGQLVGVQTQADNLMAQADRYLGPYMEAPIR